MSKILIAIIGFCLVGCATWNPTPKRAAFTTIRETADAVQSALRGYGEYIREMDKIAGDIEADVEVRAEASERADDAREVAPELEKVYVDFQNAADAAVDVIGLNLASPPTDDMVRLALKLLKLIESYQ